jgi:hypothetical protein
VVKLYQYCSSDIDNVVHELSSFQTVTLTQRSQSNPQHDGAQGSSFSGNTNPKFDNIGDDNDNDGDEDSSVHLGVRFHRLCIVHHAPQMDYSHRCLAIPQATLHLLVLGFANVNSDGIPQIPTVLYLWEANSQSDVRKSRVTCTGPNSRTLTYVLIATTSRQEGVRGADLTLLECTLHSGRKNVRFG